MLARGDTAFYYLKSVVSEVRNARNKSISMLTITKTPSTNNEHRKLEKKLEGSEALEPVKFLRA